MKDARCDVTLCLPPPGPCGWGQVGRFLPEAMRTVAPGSVHADPDLFAANLRHPVLQCIADHDMRPWRPEVYGTVKAGYCFFELDGLVARHPERLHGGAWDWIFTGSTWNERALKAAGFEDCSTVLQGVDHATFHPDNSIRPKEGQFSIFSGGKFELRKGQDIVTATFRQIARANPQAHLYACWYNPWPDTMATMEASHWVRYQHEPSLGYAGNLRRYLEGADLPLDRVHVQTLPLSAAQMADVMRQCDVGLFPNRAEGGTNLVLMEAMACGLPCIATAGTGHADVRHGLAGELLTVPYEAHDAEGLAGNWVETEPEHAAGAVLDFAAWPDLRSVQRMQAATFAADLTWERAAAAMYAKLAELEAKRHG